MKTIITTAALLLTTTAAMAGSTTHVTHNGTSYGTGNNGKFVALPSPTNGTDGATGATGATGAQGAQGQQGEAGTDGLDGATGLTGAAGTNGTDGTNGQDGNNGTNGNDGAAGVDGTDGRTGDTGATGAAGKDAVAPLGSLSFAAASSSFYGDGIGFGLSASNYSDLEGSFVLGFDLASDWRAVVGITTDFNDRHAVSAGVGFSF